MWAEYLSRHFFQEDLQMTNKHTESCSPSLVIREMWIKKMRYHFTPITMTITHIHTMASMLRKLGAPYVAGTDVKWCSHYGKQFDNSLKNNCQRQL